MDFVLPEVPPHTGWTIRQALDEIAHGKVLATLALADREHDYRVKLDRWEKAGAPRDCIEPAWYMRRGMIPRYTIDSEGMHRRIVSDEWPPNPVLLDVAYSLVYLEMGRVAKLRDAFLSGELLATGAQGHPGNRVVWLSPRVWTYYAPNVATNEARWSRTGEGGRTEIAVYTEVWEAARGRQPSTLIDNIYFGLRILVAADVQAMTAGSVDTEPDQPVGSVDTVESNHGQRAASEAALAASEQWVLPTGVSQAVKIRAALDWLAHKTTPPMPWKELAEKSQQSRDMGRGESVGWRKHEIRVREMLGIKPDDDPTEKTLANIKAVRLKWVAAKLATEARDTQERPPMRVKGLAIGGEEG